MHNLTLCKTESIDTLAHPDIFEHVELASSALSIFTDFHDHQPLVIDGNVKAVELEKLMRQSHVKMKLVLDQREQFVGIVTLADITEQKILQRVVQLGIPRSELLVVDMMQPKSMLQAFDYSELKLSSVSDVVNALRENGAMHCLVIDKVAHEIRGVISVSDIARILRIPLDIQSQPSFAALSHIIAAQPLNHTLPVRDNPVSRQARFCYTQKQVCLRNENMDIRYIKQHGDFALTMVNDIVLVNAKGPWNTECVENFGLTYAGTVYKSGMLRWADIVVLDGESLLVPEAERALTERIGRAIAAGLVQVYIVTEKSRTKITSVRQIKKLYEPHNINVEYVTELDIAIDLAGTAGFAVDAEQIRTFFG